MSRRNKVICILVLSILLSTAGAALIPSLAGGGSKPGTLGNISPLPPVNFTKFMTRLVPVYDFIEPAGFMKKEIKSGRDMVLLPSGDLNALLATHREIVLEYHKIMRLSITEFARMETSSWKIEVINDRVKVSGTLLLDKRSDTPDDVFLASGEIHLTSATIGGSPLLVTIASSPAMAFGSNSIASHSKISRSRVPHSVPGVLIQCPLETRGRFNIGLFFDLKAKSGPESGSFVFQPPDSPISKVEIIFRNPGVHPEIPGGVSDGPMKGPEGVTIISATLPGGALIAVNYSKLREYIAIDDEYLKSQRDFEALTLAGKSSSKTPSDTFGSQGTAGFPGSPDSQAGGVDANAGSGSTVPAKQVEIRRDPETFCWFHLLHDMTTKEITTYGIAKIRVDVKPVSSISFSIGPEDEVVQVECLDLESSPEIRGTGTERILCLTFTSPLMGERTVGLKIRKSVKEGSTLLVPPVPSLKDARTEIGFIGVCASENVQLTEARSGGLERIDPNELDTALISRSPAPVFFAYKYVRHSYELAMESVAYPDYSEDLLQAFVTSCDVVTKLNERGSAITETNIMLANAAMQHLEIDLDTGTELIEAAVEGKAVSPILKTGSTRGTMMIPLIRSRKEEDRAVYTPFKVSLRYRHLFGGGESGVSQAADPPAGEAGAAISPSPDSTAAVSPRNVYIGLALPNVDIKTLHWNITCPGNFSFFAPSSDAFMVNHPIGLLAFGSRFAAKFLYTVAHSLIREPEILFIIAIFSWLACVSWSRRKSFSRKCLFLVSVVILAAMLLPLFSTSVNQALSDSLQMKNGSSEVEPGLSDFRTLVFEKSLVLRGDRVWLRSSLLTRWEIFGIGFACFIMGAAGGCFVMKALADRGSLIGMLVIILVLMTGLIVSPLHPVAETTMVCGAAAAIGICCTLSALSGLRRFKGGAAAFPLIVFLAVSCLLATPAAAGADEDLLWESLPAKTLEARVPVRSGEGPGKPLPSGDAASLLSVEDFEVLSWMTRNPDEAVRVAIEKDRPGYSPEAVAAGLSITGTVFEDHAELNLEITILKRGEGPAIIKLFGPEIVPIRSATLPESVEMGPMGLRAVLHEKGVHRINCSAAVRVGKDLASGKRWLNLDLPLVPGAVMILEIPGKTVKVTVEPSVDTLPFFTKNGTKTNFKLMGSGPASVTWYDRGAQITTSGLSGETAESIPEIAAPEKIPAKVEARIPRLYSRVDSLSTIAEGFVRTGFSPSVTITYAPEESLNFRLPRGFVVHRVEGPEIKGYRVLSRETGKDDPKDSRIAILAVDLISPKQGIVGFTVQGETALPADAKTAAIPLLSLEGAVQESGTVSLATDSSLEISYHSGENIRPVDIGEGRAAVEAGGLKSRETTIILCYRYPSFPASLSMDVKKFPKVALLPLAADDTFISAFVDSMGRMMMKAEFTIKNNGSQFMAVNVPPGARVLSASVGDRTVVPAKGSEGTVLLPMKRSVMATGGFSAFPAAIVLLCPPRSGSGISTLLPTPSIFTGQTGLTLQTDREFAVLKTMTSMAEGLATTEKLVKTSFTVTTGFEDLGQTLGSPGAALATRLFDETFRSGMSLVDAGVPKIPGPTLDFNKRIELPREGATIPFAATILPSRVVDGIGLIIFYYGIVLSFLCLSLARKRKVAKLILFALFLAAGMIYLTEFFPDIHERLFDGMALGLLLAAARFFYIIGDSDRSRTSTSTAVSMMILCLIAGLFVAAPFGSPARALDNKPGFCLPPPDLTLTRGFKVTTTFEDLETTLLTPGKTGFLTSPEKFSANLRKIALRREGLQKINPSFLDSGATVTSTFVKGGLLGETFIAEVSIELSKPAWGWTPVLIAVQEAPPFLLSSEGADVLVASPEGTQEMSRLLGIDPPTGQYTLFIREPGGRKISYSVAAKLKKGDTTGFGYWIPQGAINRFRINLPKGADPKTSGIILSKVQSPRGTVIDGVSVGGPMEITWAEARGSAAETKTTAGKNPEKQAAPVQKTMTPEIRSEATTLFTIDEAVVTGYTSFNLRITGSPLREAAFSLSDARIVEVLGSEVSCWESSRDGICRVMFNRGILGLTDLSVKYERDLPRGDFEIIATVPRISEARRDSGFLAVEASPTLNLKVSSEKGLENLPIQSIPSFLHENTKRPFVAAFKYFSLPVGLKLSGSRTPGVEGSLVMAICDEMSIQAATSDNGEIVITATLQIRNKTRQFIEVTLPPGCGILNCVSAGRLVKPLERDPGSGKALLPIPPSSASADGTTAPTTVSFTYSGSMEGRKNFFGSPGNPVLETGTLPTPAIDIPVSRVMAEIFMPESKRIVAVSGDVKAQFVGLGFLPEKIGYSFFRDVCEFFSLLLGIQVKTGWEGLGLMALGVFTSAGILGMGRVILAKLMGFSGGPGGLIKAVTSTLIGIICLITIVGILIAISLPQFTSMSGDSRTSRQRQFSTTSGDEWKVSRSDADEELMEFDGEDSVGNFMMDKKDAGRPSGKPEMRRRVKAEKEPSKGGFFDRSREESPQISKEDDFRVSGKISPKSQADKTGQVQDFMMMVQSRPVKKGISGVLPVDPSIPASSLKVDARGDSISQGTAPSIFVALMEDWVHDAMKWGAVILGVLCGLSLASLFGRAFGFGRALLVILCGGAAAAVAVYLPWLQSAVGKTASVTLFLIFCFNLLSVPSILGKMKTTKPGGPDDSKDSKVPNPTVALILAGVLAISMTSGISHATVEAGSAGEIRVERLVPTGKTAKGDAIMVDPETAMAVRDLANLSIAVQQSSTIPAGGLTSLEISGEAGQKLAFLDLVVSFSKIGIGPYLIPLARNRTAVIGFESSGAESRLGENGRSLCLEVLGEGIGMARINITVPVRISGRIKTLDPELVTGLSFPFRIRRPEANLTIIPENGHSLPSEGDLCLGIITGPSTLLRIETPSESGRKTTDRTEIQAGGSKTAGDPDSPVAVDTLKKPKMTTTIFEKFTVFDLYVSATVIFENSITMAPLGSYEIPVPSGWDVLDARGTDVSGWSMASVGGRRNLIVHLHKAHIDKKVIMVEMERIFEGLPEKIEFPSLIPSTAATFTSLTGIINNTGSMMSPDLDGIKDSSGIHPNTLPPRIFGSDPSICAFAYTSSAPGRSVALRIEKPGTLMESQATCVSSVAASFFDEAGVVTTGVTYNLVNLATQHLEIALPDTAVLISASVAGKTVTPGIAGPGKFRLPLVKSRADGGGMATIPVEITFVVERGKTGGICDLDLALPSIDIETGQTTWTISTDLDAVLTNSFGDLTLRNETFSSHGYQASQQIPLDGSWSRASTGNSSYGKSFSRKQHLSREYELQVNNMTSNFQKVYSEGQTGSVTPLEIMERTGKNRFTFTTSSSSPGQRLALSISLILDEGVVISAAFLFLIGLSAMALIIWGGYNKNLTATGVGLLIFLCLLGFSSAAPGLANFIFSGAAFTVVAALAGYGATLPKRVARAITEM